MPAPDLGERVSEGLKKILIGLDDRAVEIEFDDGLRSADRIGLSQRILSELAFTSEHEYPPIKEAVRRALSAPGRSPLIFSGKSKSSSIELN
ncbi:hypothetical protein ACO2JO_08150 [Leptospira interrogans]